MSVKDIEFGLDAVRKAQLAPNEYLNGVTETDDRNRVFVDVMSALAWAAFFGKNDVVEYFLGTESVDATLKGVEGFYKNKFADEVAAIKGHSELATMIARVRSSQMEELMKNEMAERKEWVTEFLSYATIPEHVIDDYAESLVKEGYSNPSTIVLLDTDTLEKDFKNIKGAHAKLLLKAAASINKRENSYCQAFFFQLLVLIVFCGLLVMLANPNVRRNLKDLGLIV